MIYECIDCEYKTDRKDAYDRHMKSTRHNKNNCVYCKYCNISYAKQATLEKHIMNCSKRVIYEANLETEIKLLKTNLETEIKLLKAKLIDTENKLINAESLNKQINEKNNKLEDRLTLLIDKSEDRLIKFADKTESRLDKSESRVDNLIQNSGTLVNNSLNTVNKTVSALSYMNANFNTAPPLKALPNYNMFKKPKEGQLVEEMVYYHKKKMLPGYIGDVFVKEYVKSNPKDQGMWNTDTNRLTYYVRVLRDETKPNNGEWVTDKKGLLITQYTLKPLLDFLNKEINKYIRNKSVYIRKNYKGDNSKLSNDLLICGDIGTLIEQGKLEADVLKYIAPKFDLNRAKKSLLLTNKHCRISAGDELELDHDEEEEEDEQELEEMQENSDSDYDEHRCQINELDDENYGYHHNLNECDDI